MTAAAKEKREVSLPEGVSLHRVAQVLLDAWEANPRRWMNATTQLREGASSQPTMPVPQDAMDLFQLLHERQVDFLLVGGMAMLTYVKGRNTRDVDLLVSLAALSKMPELKIEDQKEFFARGKFRSIQVDLLLTKNPLFKIIAEKYATTHRFAEWEVPAANAEGLIVLKLHALPSLYRRFDMDRAAVYENDITMLIARYSPVLEPLTAMASQYAEPGDKKELQKIISECCERAKRLQQRVGQ